MSFQGFQVELDFFDLRRIELHVFAAGHGRFGDSAPLQDIGPRAIDLLLYFLNEQELRQEIAPFSGWRAWHRSNICGWLSE